MSRGRERRWPGLAAPVAATAALAVVHVGGSSLTEEPITDLLLAIALAESWLAVWAWRLARRAHGSRRGWLLLGWPVLLFAFVRCDGVTADRQPILRWRWQARARDSTADPIAKARPQYIAPRDRPVDLARTTPNDWPAYRGADRAGVVPGVRLARDWKQKPPRQRWRHPLGGGLSSVAIVGNHAVTQTQRGPDESIVCFELDSGRLCWEHRYRAEFTEYWGGVGPRATPTSCRPTRNGLSRGPSPIRMKGT